MLYFGRMKKILLAGMVLLSAACYGQRATLENDTISYLGKKYAAGDTVYLAYGSNPNKSFAFVKQGSGMAGFTALEAKRSKGAVLIDKVVKQQGKCTLRGKYLDVDIAGGGVNKIFIDIEGAIDNKEMKE